VTAGGVNFQGEFHRFLAFDFRKVDVLILVLRENFRDVHLSRCDLGFTLQETHRLAQVLDGNGGERFCPI
jgi:hypothetical protein